MTPAPTPEEIAMEIAERFLSEQLPSPNSIRDLILAVQRGTPAARWRAEGKPDPHGTDYDRERARLAHGDMTDDEIANAVYLDPSLGHLTAAKERIRWLSRRLVEATSGEISAPIGDRSVGDTMTGYVPERPADDDDVPACIACCEALKERDDVYHELSGGYVHASCLGPERENYYGDDERPLAEGEPIPAPWKWTPDRPAS